MAGPIEVTSEVEAVGDTVDILGESPVWSAEEAALYWVDIRGPFIRRHAAGGGGDGETAQSWPMPSLVGSIGLCPQRRLVVALRTSIALFDPRTGAFEELCDSAFPDPALRFNDGRVDREGRFWVGSMNDVTRAPEGELFRIAPGAVPQSVLTGIRCPNSLCWSPDGRTMYFADSDLRTIFAYDVEPATGAVTGKRPFASVAAPGVPDGCVVDADGFLWCAIYGAGRIVRYDPSGAEERVLTVPVSQPTSCAFGGEDLSTLYVTTASQRLSDEARAREPLAGRLLRLDPGARGLPEPVFSSR